MKLLSCFTAHYVKHSFQVDSQLLVLYRQITTDLLELAIRLVIIILILVLVEKLPWNQQVQLYHGPPIGHNIRFAKGSPLGHLLSDIK